MVQQVKASFFRNLKWLTTPPGLDAISPIVSQQLVTFAAVPCFPGILPSLHTMLPTIISTLKLMLNVCMAPDINVYTQQHLCTVGLDCWLGCVDRLCVFWF